MAGGAIICTLGLRYRSGKAKSMDDQANHGYHRISANRQRRLSCAGDRERKALSLPPELYDLDFDELFESDCQEGERVNSWDLLAYSSGYSQTNVKSAVLEHQ